MPRSANNDPITPLTEEQKEVIEAHLWIAREAAWHAYKRHKGVARLDNIRSSAYYALCNAALTYDKARGPLRAMPAKRVITRWNKTTGLPHNSYPKVGVKAPQSEKYSQAHKEAVESVSDVTR